MAVYWIPDQRIEDYLNIIRGDAPDGWVLWLADASWWRLETDDSMPELAEQVADLASHRALKSWG